MAYRWSVLLIETAALGFFAVAFRRFLAGHPAKVAELWCAFFYGLILEELDIYFFRTYRYGEGFLLKLGNAPLAIAFLWGLILLSSMAISDRLRIPEFSKPFLDGLLALLIDIGVDAIAIRIGYWTWTLPRSEGWFGVPAGNLYAWMWVAFWFSFFTRLVRRLALKDGGRGVYQFLVPAAAYLMLFCTLVTLGLFMAGAGWTRESQRLWLFYAHVLVFAAVAAAVISRHAKEILVPAKDVAGSDILFYSRVSIHAFFLAALLWTGLGWSQPWLALVAVTAFTIEWGVRYVLSREKLELGRARTDPVEI
ncbi:MAG: carotenoid biosynthesis protein [Candidatus Omnitrophica bacterium]|nr:carotenoid biosynthesis protein [Candidatus Omnitrophota bacterium]